MGPANSGWFCGCSRESASGALADANRCQLSLCARAVWGICWMPPLFFTPLLLLLYSSLQDCDPSKEGFYRREQAPGWPRRWVAPAMGGPGDGWPRRWLAGLRLFAVLAGAGHSMVDDCILIHIHCGPVCEMVVSMRKVPNPDSIRRGHPLRSV
jgi:hypothetical protein